MSVLRQGRTRASLCAGVAAAVLAATGTAYAVWPADGTGAASTAARALPVPALTATCGNKEIDLDWTTADDLPVVTGFAVHRSTDGGASWTLLAEVPSGSPPYAYIDTDVRAVNTYTYQVTAQQSLWTAPSATASRTLQNGKVKCI